MSKDVIHVAQGGSIILLEEEKEYLLKVFESMGINAVNIDMSQGIVTFPQAYIGYINFPNRRVVIDSKHIGIDLRHILRIYYFLYSSSSTDLDDPIYDVDSGEIIDIIDDYLFELDKVLKRGLPVEYLEGREELQYLRGNMNIINTYINKSLGKKDVFDCCFDDLSKNIPINQILYKALKKIKAKTFNDKTDLYEKYFLSVEEVNELPDFRLNTNTMYCKKAVTLALMIIENLNISDYGDETYGQNLLINFDRLFEDFVKKILIDYSGDYNFSYWDDEHNYAEFIEDGINHYKSYIPDLLYGYQDISYPASALAILDMKNKTSSPFTNADVYQMFFYANQLYCKKVILCYPSNSNKDSIVLKFQNENFGLRKIHASYINIGGNTSKEFKNNIYSFIEKIRNLL